MIEIIQKIVYVLAFLSIGFSLTEVYLSSNKIWKRKHDNEVAESVSVMAEFMAIIPGFLFALNFLFERQWQGFLDTIIYIGMSVFYVFVGIKFWVNGERKKGLFRLLKQALNSEKQEVGDLAKSFFKPSGAQTIIYILSQIALIDEKLHPKEKEFIQRFADNWNIDFSWETLTNNRLEGANKNFIKLREDVVDYLATSPPYKQVSQLKDVVNALINIDDEVSEQEKLIVAELNGLFSRYLGERLDNEVYRVVIVPQTEQQEEVIETSLPELSRYSTKGGFAYQTNSFYSKQYAAIICDQYRSLNLISFVTTIDQILVSS
ncbi:MAG: TerB family tellurite resistance protein [Moorea sp. SIO3G5]|nr:TerB family tellurite resistance protein [Moorena sp. SIO3G5]